MISLYDYLGHTMVMDGINKGILDCLFTLSRR